MTLLRKRKPANEKRKSENDTRFSPNLQRYRGRSFCGVGFKELGTSIKYTIIGRVDKYTCFVHFLDVKQINRDELVCDGRV